MTFRRRSGHRSLTTSSSCLFDKKQQLGYRTDVVRYPWMLAALVTLPSGREGS